MMTTRIISAAIAMATPGRLGRLAEPMASVRSTGRIILLARGLGLVGAFGLAAVGLLGLGACQSPPEPGTAPDPGEPTEGESMPEPSGGWTGGSDDTGEEVPEPEPQCFALAHTLVPDSDHGLMLAGDLDGDGHGDVVTAHETTAVVYLGDGERTTTAGPVPLAGNVNGARLLPHDPGRPPRFLLSAYVGTNAFHVLEIHAGTPTEVARFSEVRVLDLGDVDGDGTLDALVLTALLDQDVYLGTGDGAFEWIERQAIIPWHAVIDGDGDGLVDLVVDGVDGQPALRRGVGDGTFEPPASLGWATDDWMIEATPTTLHGSAALLLSLQQSCSGGCAREAGFVLLAPEADGHWSERDRTPWLGDAWLDLAEPLGAAAPLAFTVRSFESLHRRAFVVDADGRMHGGDTELGYRVRLGELDGVAPAELVSTWVGERPVWSLGGEGWEDPQDIEPTIEPDFVVDFDGDGLDDLVGQESGGIEVWRNLGCLGG
jgi:hypothetical protein